MARVQMYHAISGGRGDGTDWPPAGGILECDDDEARALVSGGNARWAEDAAPSAPAAPAETPAGDATPEAADGAESLTAPPVRAAKEAWVMHAVNLGVTPELAAAMTKADLVQQFSR